MKTSIFWQRLVCLLCSAIFFTGSLQAQDSITKFEGWVVAQDNVSRLFMVQNYAQQEIFFVRTLDKHSNRETSQIIKIVHQYRSLKEKLPEQVFSSDKKWSFKVVRNVSCDVRVEKWSDNPNIFLIDSNDLPSNIDVPCYILKRKGVKGLTRKR
jgi:hypothetical protein